MHQVKAEYSGLDLEACFDCVCVSFRASFRECSEYSWLAAVSFGQACLILVFCRIGGMHVAYGIVSRDPGGSMGCGMQAPRVLSHRSCILCLHSLSDHKSPQFESPPRMHARTHAHTHKRTCTCTRTRARMRTRTRIRALAPSSSTRPSPVSSCWISAHLPSPSKCSRGRETRPRLRY